MVTMFFFFMVLVLALLLYCNHLMDMLLRERRLNRENMEIDDEDIILLDDMEQEASDGKRVQRY